MKHTSKKISISPSRPKAALFFPTGPFKRNFSQTFFQFQAFNLSFT